MKGFSRRAALALTVVLSTAPIATLSHARDLTIVAFGGSTQDALRTAYFEPFSEQTGVHIIEDQSPNLAKVRAMVQTNSINWDIVYLNNAEVAVGCDQGLFERLDFSKIGTNELDYIDGALTECGLGILVPGYVLAYDGDRLQEAPKSWADFWNVEKWPGKRGLNFKPNGTLEVALMADGVAPKDVYKVLRTPEGVDRAFRKLDELKPHIVWWTHGGEFLNRLASGEYVMTYAWNGRIDVVNRKENRNFKIVWPAGFTYTIDQWTIVKGSPNKDLSYDFFRFFNDPQRQAHLSSLIAYSPPTKEAANLVSASRQADLPVSKENRQYGVLVDQQFWQDNLAALTQRFNAWAAQ